MKAKEFLRQVRKLDKLIENKMIEIQQWKDVADNTSAVLSGERVKSSHNPHKIADAIGRYVDLETELQEDIDNLISAKKRVLKVIEQLDALEYDILHKLYVQHYTLWDIADKYKRTYSWVTTVHGQAVKNVQEILDREVV